METIQVGMPQDNGINDSIFSLNASKFSATDLGCNDKQYSDIFGDMLTCKNQKWKVRGNVKTEWSTKGQEKSDYCETNAQS